MRDSLDLEGGFHGHAIKDELFDELLADYENSEDLLGKDAIFQIVIFDALRVKIRDKGVVKNKAVSWPWG